MVAVQTTYAERHGYAVEGQIADAVPYNIVTRLCETVGGIGFGKAVSRGAKDKGVVIGGTVAGFAGITVQEKTLVHDTVDKYYPPENRGVLNFGMIYVLAGANVNDGDPVYFNPTTGAISNSAGAATVGTPTPGAGNVGGGTFTKDATPSGAGVTAGTWCVGLREPVAAGGIWDVLRPDGTREGEATTGTLYNGGLRFTIADGTPDWAAGDEFSMGVTMAAEGPVPNARWVDTTTSGSLGRG